MTLTSTGDRFRKPPSLRVLPSNPRTRLPIKEATSEVGKRRLLDGALLYSLLCPTFSCRSGRTARAHRSASFARLVDELAVVYEAFGIFRCPPEKVVWCLHLSYFSPSRSTK